MLRPMPDAAEPPEPPPPPPFEPIAAEPTQVYTLPTARRVVSSGLQLALSSTSDLRRASIYIGLLVLGSFGPAIIAVLLIVGRLGDRAGDALGSVFLGQSYGAPPQPALEAALLVVAIEALVGVALFLTISIDAQIMGIAILGGRASERPLRLWESIIRARQTFWRVAGAGAVVGVVSLLVQGFVATALGGFSRSVDAASILAGIIATVVVAPLAYVSTSIVLGDVGAMESLSRSWRLFKARRLLAVVVVLFTFVTSAIQLFALSAGLDLIVRASELLHVSLTEGVVAFAVAVILILAAVVAYGSLTFTIGAVVSAPQVTGFLGLTFFSGGLDRARVDGPRPPRGFRYITRPMAIAMIALAGIVGLEIPAINSIPPPQESSILELVRSEAAAQSDLIDIQGFPAIVEDRAGDLAAGQAAGPPDADIVRAEVAYIDVPSWLLERLDCADTNVACATGSARPDAFADGAVLFLVRVAAPVDPLQERSTAVLLSFEDEVTQLRHGGTEPYGGASRVVTTTFGTSPAITARRSDGDAFISTSVAARSMWTGADLYVLIALADLPFQPLGWDAVTLVDPERGLDGGGDTLRAIWDAPLREWDFYASIFIDDYRVAD